MLSYRPGTVNDFHLGLNQFRANLTLSQHLLKKKMKTDAFILSTRAT